MAWVRTTFVALACWGVLGVAVTYVVRRIEGELTRTQQALNDLCAEQARRERAEAERKLAEEAALQAQKMELVGRFAAGAAHDFNNVLSVVAGWAELGLDEAATPVDRSQAKDAMQSSVQQGQSLTRQLLALSRRDARVVRRFALQGSIGSGVRTLSRVLPPGVTLTFDRTRHPDLEVAADEAELQQVLFNLVLNARDALPQTGGSIQVRAGLLELRAERDVVGGTLPVGNYAILEVEDNGSGIDPALRERIFELFFTTKPAGLGTGLGLTTVLRIAQEGGGGVALQSEPGRGTTLTLLWPAVRPPAVT